jgi:hypothetical protein
MGFTNDEEGGGDGRMPPIVATIVDACVDYREYDNGNEESRLVVLLKPDSEVFGVQTVILSNTHILKVKPNERDIRVGGSEHGFTLEIIGNVINSGKLGYKAALWMAKLKALNVKIPEDTGDLSELIGIKALFKQLTYNEAKGRPKRETEKVFWVPVELVSTSVKTSVESTVEKPVEEEEVEQPSAPRTLEEDILSNAEGKSEADLVNWYEGSVYYNGNTVVPLFVALTEMSGQGKLKEQKGVYKVGIGEPIAEVKQEVDDFGPLEEEQGAPSASLGVNI